MQPLDEKTWRAAADVINRGRIQGVSAITALHSAGLLLGDDLACRIREDVLRSLADHLRLTKLRDIMPDRDHYLRNGATPTQTRDAIIARVEELAEMARRGGFR